MCVGEAFALVGTEAIAPDDRALVLEQLRKGGREIIEVGQDEIERFAGNMLELATWDEALGDSRVLVMSTSARGRADARCLRPPQRLHRYAAGRPRPHHRETERRQRSLHAG